VVVATAGHPLPVLVRAGGHLTQTEEMDAVRELNRELMAKLNTSRR